MPRALPPASSISPVCSPARISRPSGRTAIADVAGAADSTGRAIESREESVAGRVDLVPTEPLELPADDRMVAVEQFAPGPVAEPCGVARRADDVGHEHGGEDTVGRALGTFAGQELLGLVQDRVLIADPWHVVIAGQLDEAGTGNLRRHPAALLDVHAAVGGAVHDEARDVDRGQYVRGCRSRCSS